MQVEFQNLKISITDEVHLKAVCDVLESVGFKKRFTTKGIVSAVVTDTHTSYFAVLGIPIDLINDCAEVNLTDLLRMRDKYFKEAIK